MKIQTIHSKNIPDHKLVVACDVGKDKLDAYCEIGQQCVQDNFPRQISGTDTVMTTIALGPRNLGDCRSKIRLRRKE